VTSSPEKTHVGRIAVVNVANNNKAMQYFQERTSKVSEPLFGIERKATACQEVVEVIRV
jgi:hypothetical protein